MMSMFPTMEAVAANGLKRQKARDGDYIGKDGLLYCGTCGEARQAIRLVPDPIPDDPEHNSPLKVVRSCLCERREEEQKQREEQAKKDMEIVSSLRSASLMDRKMIQSTFGTFRPTKANARNLKLCKRYAEGFDEMFQKNQGLLLWGGVGTGKSFAAGCIANYLLDRKVPVIMTSFVKLISLLEADRSQYEEIINKLNRVKLVIFDDLGAERGTDAAIEKVYSIVDGRYRSSLPMIVTTNRSMDEMMGELDTRYSRIYDRIFEVCYPMEFTGASWRKKAASQAWRDMERMLEDE